MKFNKQFLLYVLVLAMALLVIGITARPVDHDHDQVAFSVERINDHHLEKQEVEASLRYHFHKKQPRHKMTCKRFPMICQAQGSQGPHCCKNKCVNVLSDKQNCGVCGKKCKYNEICCGGKCVNPSFDRRHCGGCNNRCNKAGFCTFGLCDYA